MCELFTYQGDNCHIVYKNLFRDTDDETGSYIKYLRQHISNLWERFKNYADPHFKEEFCRNPDQRYWEMYLGCCLLDRGFDIKTNKAGPDFCLNIGGKKVWIEAITASPGQENSPDCVPEGALGIAQAVPRDKIILRYRASLAEKEKKYASYLKKGVVEEDDIKIIAVSGGSLRRWPTSDTHPFILSAVFPMGHHFLSIERQTGEVVDQGRHFQPCVKKNNGAEVETLFFLDPAHSDISAVIYSSSDMGNPPKQHGSDLLIIHNPLARNPIPRSSLKLPTDYWIEDVGEAWTLHHEDFED